MNVSGVLPYSRLGTQENIMAYRFMTEPLSVNDLTVAKKDNLEGQEVKFEVSDEKKEAEEKKHQFYLDYSSSSSCSLYRKLSCF